MSIKSDDTWTFNKAPGYSTGSMAAPATVRCCECGREIYVDEDCFDTYDEWGDGIFLCVQCHYFKVR